MDENGLRLRMYRYVDDINVVVNSPKADLKFLESEGKVVEDGSAAAWEREVKAFSPQVWQQHSLINRVGGGISFTTLGW